MSRSFIGCRFFSILTSASCGPSNIAELFVEFCVTMQSNWDKKFENARWRTVAILKIEKSPYLQIVWPIFTKFCVMTHISRLKLMSCSKIQIKKNPKWWTATILKKHFKCDNYSAVQPIFTKFGITMHISRLARSPAKNLNIQYGGRRP